LNAVSCQLDNDTELGNSSCFVTCNKRGEIMRKLSESSSAQTVLESYRFVLIRLRSRPETAGLVEGMSELRSALNAANEAYYQAYEERCAATAEIDYLDAVLDATVGDLAREVAVLVKNHREDPRYYKLFPVAPSQAMRQASVDQDRFVTHIISLLAEDEDYTSLRSHADILSQHLKALREAVSTREALYTPEATANGQRQAVLDKARRAYNQLKPQLELIFPSRSQVDSFFPSSHRNATESKTETE
jgi:hypothetical protein